MHLAIVPTPRLTGQSGSMVYARNQVKYLAQHVDRLTMIVKECEPIAEVAIIKSPIVLPHPIEEDLTVTGDNFFDSINAIVLSLLRAHDECPIDIVHAFYSTFTGYAACFFKALTGVPVVLSCFGRDVNPGIHAHPIGARLSAMCLPEANALIASNAPTAYNIRQLCNGLEREITVIPMGIDEELFSSDKITRETARRHLGWSQDNKIVLDVTSSVLPDKRVDVLISVIIEVLKKNSSAMFVFVGPMYDGGSGLADRIQKAVERSEVKDRILFIGRVPNTAVPLYMAAADMFVDLRAVSNFSSGLIEATAMELPVLASAMAADQIIAGREFVEIAPEDRIGLERRILGMLEDDKYRETMKIRAKRWWASEKSVYSLSGTTQSHIRVYEKILVAEN